MTQFLALATLVLGQTAAAPQEKTPAPGSQKTKLARIYKEGESDRYKVDVSFDAGGQQITATAEILSKVNKLLDKGRAEITMSVTSLDMQGMPEAANNLPIPAPITGTFDSANMPSEVDLKGDKFAYFLISLAAYLPSQEMKGGDSYTLDYKSAGSALKLKGKGTFKELTTIDSNPVAVLESEVEGTPGSEEPAKIKLLSYISVASGKLVKCTGSIGAQGQQMNFTIGTKK